MKYLVKRFDQYMVAWGNRPADALATWPEDIDPRAVSHLTDELNFTAAQEAWLRAETKRALDEEKAARIKREFDEAEQLIGFAAVSCFGTANVDAMNADKDTVIEILKGNGYLVGAGFRARRDIPEELIVKGQVLNDKEDLERYAAAMWQRILAYGQTRVQIMAQRDDNVERIEAEYE